MSARRPPTNVKNVFVPALIESITSCRVHRQPDPPRWVMPSCVLLRGCLLMHVTWASAMALLLLRRLRAYSVPSRELGWRYARQPPRPYAAAVLTVAYT